MTKSEQNIRSKIQDFFQWLNNYSFQPKREMREGTKLLYDVQVMEGIVKILNDFNSAEEIQIVCRAFYDAYLSGDRKLKLIATLILPAMLNTYLVHFHSYTSVESMHTKQAQVFRSRRNSQPIFTIDDQLALTSPLESIAFLLSEFCQLAPAFIRCPERYSSDIANLPDYRVASVYHSPFGITTKPQTSKTTISVKNGFNKLKFDNANAINTNPLSNFPDIDSACIIRIYVDTLTRQFEEGTEEQQGVVVMSIRTFCDFVDRLTALDTRRILPCSHRHLLCLLTDLSIAIDKLLFMLSFEISQPADPSATSSSSDDMKALRDRIFEELLQKIERYAGYHCFASVLLIVGAMRNAWRLRLQPIAAAHTATITPMYRRVRLTSYDETDLSDSTPDDSTDHSHAAKLAASHRLSVFTNANFRAEPVSEDIPISNGLDAGQTVAADRRKKVHLPHSLIDGSHNHIHHHHRRHHYLQQQDMTEGMTRSSDNLRFPSSSSLDKDGQNHGRFWSKHRREKS